MKKSNIYQTIIITISLCACVQDNSEVATGDDRIFFRTVSSPGLTQGGSCSADDPAVELRFVLLDQVGRVIRTGDALSSGILSGSSFNTADIAILDARLMPVHSRSLVRCDDRKVDEGGNPNPSDCFTAGLDICAPYDANVDDLGKEFVPTDGGDVGFCRTACTTDAECGRAACVDGRYCAITNDGDFCADNNDCPSGFECAPIDSNSSQKMCSVPTTVTVKPGSLAFLSPLDDNTLRAVTIIIDNSGSIHGKGVTEKAASFCVDDDSPYIPDRDDIDCDDRATDPYDARIAASRLFFLSLRNQSYYNANTISSIWSFRGETASGVTPHTGDPTQGNPFVVNTAGGPDGALNALEQIRQASDFGRSNVFLALEQVANNGIELGINDSRDWTMVLFVDGPDDSVVISPDDDEAARESARQRWQSNYERALAAVTEAGATVYIIHLDTALGADGLKVLEPDPENAMPFPRDAEGRFGPLPEYAQIACATGGSYIYVRDPGALLEKFALLTDLIGGLWKVDVSIDTLAGPNIPNGPYRFGGTLTVNADKTSDSFFFSPLGDESAFGVIDEDDSRGLLFKRQRGADRP